MRPTLPDNSKLLIVDDHHIIRRTLREWLTKKFDGLEIFEASSGEEALTILSQNSVNYVLLDFHLPGINGIETTKRIKIDSPATHVVILTVQEDVRYQDTAAEAGANGYVIKRMMYTDLLPALFPGISFNGDKNNKN